MATPKIVSTTALAKHNNLEAKALFTKLQEAGLLEKRDGAWLLTKIGEAQGGTYIESPKYGKYVGWPDDLKVANIGPSTTNSTPDTPAASSNDKSYPTEKRLLTATRVAQHFELSATKCNYIFSELGWLKKALKGWLLTEPGKRLGGVQSEDQRSGIPYCQMA